MISDDRLRYQTQIQIANSTKSKDDVSDVLCVAHEKYLDSICDAMDGHALGSGTKNAFGSTWGGDPKVSDEVPAFVLRTSADDFLIATSITISQSPLSFSAKAFLSMR